MSTQTRSPRTPAREAARASARTAGSGYRTAWWVGVSVLAALIVAVAVVATTDSSSDQASRTVDRASVIPHGLTDDGWVAIGDGPVTVSVYFDYLCPACRAFEEANGATLEQLLQAGDVTVELRPMSFLDHLSAETRYSTRAANALATVADADPAHAWAFHRALYANQPQEGDAGLTDQQLVDIAREVDVPDRVSATFVEGRFEDWVAERTEVAFADGVEGTPTILIDAEKFEGDPYETASLVAAVEQVAG